MKAGVTKQTAFAIALLWLGCGPPPPPPAPTAAPVAPRPGDFSGDHAAAHLEALRKIGARPAGSEGARRAREYPTGALGGLGLEVQEQRAPGSPGGVLETVNVFAAIPGESPDAILLVAPYDSPPEAGAEGGDGSGAALVLELGRALKARRLPYTVWLAFVEGDALLPASKSSAAHRDVVGTHAFVAGLGGEGRAERVRVAVYFDRVAEPDLRVARDLLSNRTWREAFWSAAHRLRDDAIFPPDAPFESVEGGQRAFLASGMRQAVAIVGSRSEPTPAVPASDSRAGDPARAPNESLAVVGAVSVDALVAISERLAKIDRFVASPVSASQPAGGRPAEPAAGGTP